MFMTVGICKDGKIHKPLTSIRSICGLVIRIERTDRQYLSKDSCPECFPELEKYRKEK